MEIKLNKLLNILLITTSLVGYMQWGKGNSAFIYDVLHDLITNPETLSASLFHPIIFIPLIGIMFLLITLFQKKPSKILTFIGIGCVSLLLLLIFFIGLLSNQVKMVASALPFILLSFLAIRLYTKL